jgi:hypothetical protein
MKFIEKNGEKNLLKKVLIGSAPRYLSFRFGNIR